MPTSSELVARRIGRITFGGVLLAGVAYLTLAALSTSLWHDAIHRVDAAWIISVTWVAAAVAGAVVRAVAARIAWRAQPDALFAESVIAPAAGVALLLPITLHMPIALMISDGRGFDLWVVASMWVTGLAHVVFAGSTVMRALQLVAGKPAWSPRRIYVLTLLTSCVPFIILWAIPPALVAITALPLIPILHAMDRWIARERAEIAAAPRALPRAVARTVVEATGSSTRA